MTAPMASELSCEICGANFQTARELAEHKEGAHDGEKVDFNCENCGDEFQDRESLTEHFELMHAKTTG